MRYTGSVVVRMPFVLISLFSFSLCSCRQLQPVWQFLTTIFKKGLWPITSCVSGRWPMQLSKWGSNPWSSNMIGSNCVQTEHRDAELRIWNTFEYCYLQFVGNCCSTLPWSLQWKHKWTHWNGSWIVCTHSLQTWAAALMAITTYTYSVMENELNIELIVLDFCSVAIYTSLQHTC